VNGARCVLWGVRLMSLRRGGLRSRCIPVGSRFGLRGGLARGGMRRGGPAEGGGRVTRRGGVVGGGWVGPLGGCRGCRVGWLVGKRSVVGSRWGGGSCGWLKGVSPAGPSGGPVASGLGVARAPGLVSAAPGSACGGSALVELANTDGWRPSPLGALVVPVLTARCEVGRRSPGGAAGRACDWLRCGEVG